MKAELDMNDEVVALEKAYYDKIDWEVQENANIDISYGGFVKFLLDKLLKKESVILEYLPEKAVKMHFNGDIHIHKLPHSLYLPYCTGWSYRKLLLNGLVTPTMVSRPPKHADTAVSQLVSFFCTAAQEWTGAQAVSAFDLYLGAFVKHDKPSPKAVKQILQRMLFDLNYPTRIGFQSAFTNITVLLDTNEQFLEEEAVVAGKTVGKLRDGLDEAILVSKELFKLFIEGDALGQPFSFPIPTLMVTKNFDWNGSKWDGLTDLIFEALSKRGSAYLLNGNAAEVESLFSMCLHPDEPIIVKANGIIRRMPIKDFAEEYAENEDIDGWSNVNSDVYALAVNPENYKVRWAKIRRVYRARSRWMVRIRTKDGREIKVTPDHPVVVYTTERLKLKRASDIRKGDIMLVLKRAARILEEKPVMLGKFEVNEEFSYVVGLFLAEGNYLTTPRRNLKPESLDDGKYLSGLQFSLNSMEKEIIERLRDFSLSVLGKEPRVVRDKRYTNLTYVCIYSHELAQLLYRNGVSGSKPRQVPWFIWSSPPKIVRSFLRGFFEGDGYSRGREIHINDPKLTKDLALLFLIAGIPTTVRFRESGQTLRLCHVLGRGSKKGVVVRDTLFNRIPWISVRRHKGVGYHDGFYSLKTITKHNAWTDEARKMLKGDVAFIPVESVVLEELPQEISFYDVELEEVHLFVHSMGTITHNCCRLTLDVEKVKNFELNSVLEDVEEELRRSRGARGLWAVPDATGSIGVVTINLPRIGVLARGDWNSLISLLDERIEVAREVLKVWRGRYKQSLTRGLMPLTKRYLGHFNGHYSTVGLVGLPETVANFMENPALWDDLNKTEIEEAISLMKKIVSYVRKRVEEFEEEDGCLYNVEEVPAESAGTRLAILDREKFMSKYKSNEILIPGGDPAPFYSNSVIPYYASVPVSLRAEWEGEVQTEFTGGVIMHLFLNESPDPEALKKLARRIVENTNVVYFSFTPNMSVCLRCDWHSVGVFDTCPKCGSNRIDVWSRIVGYYRPVRTWNDGKKAEFKNRATYGGESW